MSVRAIDLRVESFLIQKIEHILHKIKEAVICLWQAFFMTIQSMTQCHKDLTFQLEELKQKNIQLKKENEKLEKCLSKALDYAQVVAQRLDLTLCQNLKLQERNYQLFLSLCETQNLNQELLQRV